MNADSHVCLVTGGAGFIGSHLVDRLLAEGMQVVALDNLYTGRLSNLRRHLANRRFRFLRGDISEFNEVRKAVRAVDVVFHEAAIVSQDVAQEKPQMANSANVAGTLNVLRACNRYGGKKVVFASSSAIYGEPDSVPVSEETASSPSTIYAVSKLSAESYCRAFHRSFGLDVVCLRYFNVYGPRQRGTAYSGVISIFAKRLLAGKPPIIHGDGTQLRDFVHVRDVVEANIRAMKSETACGEVINIGSGKPTSIGSLADALAKMMGKQRLLPIHDDPRTNDVRRSCADITKARKLLDFEPSIHLEQGLRTVMGWLSNRASQI